MHAGLRLIAQGRKLPVVDDCRSSPGAALRFVLTNVLIAMR